MLDKDTALELIARIAGNLPDDRLNTPTGPNDARMRGQMLADARNYALAALGITLEQLFNRPSKNE